MRTAALATALVASLLTGVSSHALADTITETGAMGAPGMAGANVNFTNSLSPSSTAPYDLTQNAFGGTGGTILIDQNFVVASSGSGGNALSRLTVSNSSARVLSLQSNATGGSSGTFYAGVGEGAFYGGPVGNGGNAEAQLIVHDYAATGTNSFSTSAIGGMGGTIRGSAPGFGGNAAAATTVDTVGFANVVSIASGGSGGSAPYYDDGYGGGYGSGANGGNATASATGRTTGSNSMAVSAQSVGGDGGGGEFAGGIAGTASGTTAFGSSGSGAVSVSVSQTGGNGGSGAGAENGASSTLINAVGGSTTGSLSLSQAATGGVGGDGGSSFGGGQGGNATSNLTLKQSTATSFSAVVAATGGNGGVDYGLTGGSGGDASANVHIATIGVTSLSATAQGGLGGPPVNFGQTGMGGKATASAYGTTIGDNAITVSATATAGQGNTALATAFGSSDSGAVSVSATQNEGGGIDTFTSDGEPGVDSVMDNAVSGKTAGSLSLSQTAIGGAGGIVFGEPNGPGNSPAGNAVSTLSLVNATSNALTLSAQAIGGVAANNDANTDEVYTNSPPVDGGTGTSEVSINDTKAATIIGRSTAAGGAAGENVGGSDSVAQGGAANANLFIGSTTAVTATGSALATGGVGSDAGYGVGGTGGDATAEATVVSIHQGALVTSNATAYGGQPGANSYDVPTPLGNLGNATAAASSGSYGLHGEAISNALAVGTAASATAASAVVSGTQSVRTTAAAIGATSVESNTVAGIALTTAPTATLPSAGQAVSAGELTPGASQIAIGAMGVGDNSVSAAQYSLSAEYNFSQSGGGDLTFDVLDPQSTGNGFTDVSLDITDNGTTLFDESFSSAAALESAFADPLLLDAADGSHDLDIALLTSGDVSGFGFGYTIGTTPLAAYALVSAVPLPGAFWSFSAATLGLAFFTKRRRAPA